MSAQVTEAHHKLAQSINKRWCSYDDAAQLIADSEAGELEPWKTARNELLKTRDQLRAEVERLKNLLLQADELNEGALFKISETMKRAERAEAKVQLLRAGIAECLHTNRHLADGEDCTLIGLKRCLRAIDAAMKEETK
jgi:regulator of replication initiation timing